jgi:hypothetical protein
MTSNHYKITTEQKAKGTANVTLCNGRYYILFYNC